MKRKVNLITEKSNGMDSKGLSANIRSFYSRASTISPLEPLHMINLTRYKIVSEKIVFGQF